MKEHLLQKCNEIKQTMHIKIDEIMDAMSRDYIAVLEGREIPQHSKILRLQIRKVLSEINTSSKTRDVDDTLCPRAAAIKQEDIDSRISWKWAAESRFSNPQYFPY
jgi:hypothetical protein